MKVHFSFLLFLLSTYFSVLAASPLPSDVGKFVEQRDGCDHFRGEEPYDEERAQFLRKKLDELCTGTDKKLAHLKKKYKTRDDVIKKLNEYEPKIEVGVKN